MDELASVKLRKVRAQVAEMRKKYIGGPTPIYLAKRLTAECGGAQVAAV